MVEKGKSKEKVTKRNRLFEYDCYFFICYLFYLFLFYYLQYKEIPPLPPNEELMARGA